MTQSIEDYLKAIYKLTETSESISTNDLAAYMGVSAASVTNMLKRLASMDLVAYESYKGVALKGKGRQIALEILRHHRLLELYLAEVFGYELDEVHEEAERLEHHISEQFEASIDRILGFPSYDPHGDPIPSKSGEMPEIYSTALTDVEVGHWVCIRRIPDDDIDLLRFMLTVNLVPNVYLKIESKAPFEGPITVLRDGKIEIIGYKVASKIIVSIERNKPA